MLHVGKNTIKTVIALLASLFPFIVLIGLNHLLGFNELPSVYVTSKEFWYVPTNWYTPFFAGIAAIYAMSPNVAASRKQANIRSIGSVIGGYWGYAVFMIFTLLFPNAVKGYVSYYVPLFIITALGIVPLMKMIRMFRIPQAGFITGLTYLAVCISIRNGGMGPLLFTTNRVLSTVIGVSIAVYVSTYPHFRKKHQEILFISALDGALYDQNEEINEHCLHRLSDFTHFGVNFTYLTEEPITCLRSDLKDVKITKPVIVMDGAAVYKPGEGYDEICTMHKGTEQKIRTLLAEYDVHAFSYVFNEHHLFGYYDVLSNEAERSYYQRHDQALMPMVKAAVPADLDVTEMIAVIRKDQQAELLKDLYKISEISVHLNEDGLPEGYVSVHMTDIHAQPHHAFEKAGLYYEKLVVIGGSEEDIGLMKMADRALCLRSAPAPVRACASQIIDSDAPEALLEEVKKIFFKGL